jgi:hypothetical protein
MRIAASLLSCLFLALCAASTFGQDAPPVWESPHFRFHAPAELMQAAEGYRTVLDTARRRAGEHWSAPLNTPIDVFLWPREAWDQLSRKNPAMRDVLAFVRSNDQSVVLNHAGCRREGMGRLRQTLIHEYVHVYFGRMMARWPDEVPVRRLPRWMEEGLAMSVAGEAHLWDTAQLRWQGPSRMIPLIQLGDGFPNDPAGQEQAYRQSIDAVKLLIEEHEGLTPLIDEIVDPARGPKFVALAWNAQAIRGFESRWHATLRLGWRWMLIFTSGGFMWVIVMVLAAFAWRKRRLRARQRIARWALEAEGLIPTGLDDDEQEDHLRRLLKGD